MPHGTAQRAMKSFYLGTLHVVSAMIQKHFKPMQMMQLGMTFPKDLAMVIHGLVASCLGCFNTDLTLGCC